MYGNVDGGRSERRPSERRCQAADNKAQGLISTKVPQELCDLNNIENLILAETKDLWNWELLASLEKKIVDPELKGIVTRAVRAVRTQEKTHLNWNERALTTLAREAAIKGPAVVETEATEHTDLGCRGLASRDGETASGGAPEYQEGNGSDA